MFRINIRKKRHEIEVAQRWIEEAKTMPLMKFPQGWQIQMIPPFSDAVVRFKVILPSGLEKSVFLDSRCSLEMYFDNNLNPVPYWEVSPVAGKFGRCGKYDIDTLIEMIAYEE